MKRKEDKETMGELRRRPGDRRKSDRLRRRG